MADISRDPSHSVIEELSDVSSCVGERILYVKLVVGEMQSIDYINFGCFKDKALFMI